MNVTYSKLEFVSQWLPFMLQYFQCCAYSRANQGSYSRAVLALLYLKHFYIFLNESKHAQCVRSKHTHVGKINIITLWRSMDNFMFMDTMLMFMREKSNL